MARLPARSEVPAGDRWDLSSLFSSDAAWEKAFAKWTKQLSGYDKFRGRLREGASVLAACLEFDSRFDRAGERLGSYAFLKTAENAADSKYQRMKGRLLNVASRAAQAASYIRPEIMAVPAAVMKEMLAEKRMAPWRVLVERMFRYKPHTLSKNEEKLLAMQTEMAQAARHIFHQLHDSDMKFGTVKDETGRLVELAHGNYSKFMESPKRSVRKAAYRKYFGRFAENQHALAASLSASIQRDVYYGRARKHESSLDKSLFSDRVPRSVYENLIHTVDAHLPALHRYWELRNKVLRLKKFGLYDMNVPLVPEARMKHTWRQAVEVVLAAIEPLGGEYCKVLESGLRGRWCDRYPNQGKAGGAFSAGSYDGDPYILMNFQPDVLDHVFTLAHEAGHSMHSSLSAKHQPYQYYDYAIFVAEVASTFNEQLLSDYLMGRARSDIQRAMLINRQIDNIRGTLYRQTMFAEFEKVTHEMAEAGEPVTLEAIKDIYGKLLARYLGPTLDVDDYTLLECLRIPHFYRAFYVYKYATGISAAIALARRVTGGGRSELDDYLNFLKGGCSKYPLELLAGAGVDMAKPEPVAVALEHFAQLVDQLGELIH